MPLTSEEIRKYLPQALRLARDNANLSWHQASSGSRIDELTLKNHEGGINLPSLDVFLDELKAYSLDFLTFHELLLEVKIREQYGWVEESRDDKGRIIPSRKTP